MVLRTESTTSSLPLLLPQSEPLRVTTSSSSSSSSVLILEVCFCLTWKCSPRPPAPFRSDKSNAPSYWCSLNLGGPEAGCSQTNRCRVLLLFCAYFAFLLQAVFLRRSTDRFTKPDQSFKSSFLPVQVKNHRMCALCRFSRLPLKASAFMIGSCDVCIFVQRAPAVLEVSSCPVWTSETSLRAHVGLQLLLKDRSMNQWSCEPEHRSGAFTCTARLL